MHALILSLAFASGAMACAARAAHRTDGGAARRIDGGAPVRVARARLENSPFAVILDDASRPDGQVEVEIPQATKRQAQEFETRAPTLSALAIADFLRVSDLDDYIARFVTRLGQMRSEADLRARLAQLDSSEAAFELSDTTLRRLVESSDILRGLSPWPEWLDRPSARERAEEMRAAEVWCRQPFAFVDRIYTGGATQLRVYLPVSDCILRIECLTTLPKRTVATVITPSPVPMGTRRALERAAAASGCVARVIGCDMGAVGHQNLLRAMLVSAPTLPRAVVDELRTALAESERVHGRLEPRFMNDNIFSVNHARPEDLRVWDTIDFVHMLKRIRSKVDELRRAVGAPRTPFPPFHYDRVVEIIGNMHHATRAVIQGWGGAAAAHHAHGVMNLAMHYAPAASQRSLLDDYFTGDGSWMIEREGWIGRYYATVLLPHLF